MKIPKLMLFIVIVMGVSHALAQNPTVTSLYPDRNAMHVPQDVNIVVTFDQELLAGSINDTTVFVWGDVTGKHNGVISYESGTGTMTFDPNYDFLVGEIVTVQLTQGIQALDATPLDQSQYWTFTIATTAGTGIFTLDHTYIASSDPFSWAVVDMDGDYDADLVTKDFGGAINVRENDGYGNFIPWDIFYTGFVSFVAMAGDINGDTLIDLMGVRTGYCDSSMGFTNGRLGAMLNNGNGTFDVVESSTSWCCRPANLELVDLNVDGALDALIDYAGSDFCRSDTAAGFGWQKNLNAHDGGFQPYADHEFDMFDHSRALLSPGVTGDYNNDGFADFMVTPLDDPIRRIVYSHNNDGVVTFDTVAFPFTGTSTPQPADFNGDGWLDLCMQDATSWPDISYSIILNNQDGTFSLGGRYVMPGRCVGSVCAGASFTLGDVNADGSTDIVAIRRIVDFVPVADDSGFAFLNNGDGTFGELLPFPPVGGQPYVVDLVDLDSDGDLDLVARDQYKTTRLMPVLTNLDSLPPAVCGDANGDDEPNVGDAVFLIAYVFGGGPPPDPACAGDANGDGDCNVGDAVYLISYVFKGGPPPVESCCY